MGRANSSLFINFLVLIFAIERIIVTKAVLPFETEDLNVKQWSTVSPQFKTWVGFWVRYDTSAKPVLTSTVNRNSTYLNDATVLQSTDFRNRKVPTAGLLTSGVYREGIFNNPKRDSSSLYFYPSNWGIIGSPQILGKSSSVEKFFINGNERVSCIPVYRDGQLSELSLFRERIFPRKVRSSEALRERTRSIGGTAYVLRGVWSRSQECIGKDYIYVKETGLFRDFQVPLPTGHQRFAYEFAWRIGVSVPRTVGGREPFSAYFLWRVSPKKVITGYTRYGRRGTFEKDCSTTFLKIKT